VVGGRSGDPRRGVRRGGCSVLGGLLISTGGYRSLFDALTVLARVTVWAALAVPAVPALPRRRQTALDLARRLSGAVFL
jgi:MFS transporter, DHA1 family, tetracycline resistance protein